MTEPILFKNSHDILNFISRAGIENIKKEDLLSDLIVVSDGKMFWRPNKQLKNKFAKILPINITAKLNQIKKSEFLEQEEENWKQSRSQKILALKIKSAASFIFSLSIVIGAFVFLGLCGFFIVLSQALTIALVIAALSTPLIALLIFKKYYSKSINEIEMLQSGKFSADLCRYQEEKNIKLNQILANIQDEIQTLTDEKEELFERITPSPANNFRYLAKASFVVLALLIGVVLFSTGLLPLLLTCAIAIPLIISAVIMAADILFGESYRHKNVLRQLGEIESKLQKRKGCFEDLNNDINFNNILEKAKQNFERIEESLDLDKTSVLEGDEGIDPTYNGSLKCTIFSQAKEQVPEEYQPSLSPACGGSNI